MTVIRKVETAMNRVDYSTRVTKADRFSSRLLEGTLHLVYLLEAFLDVDYNCPFVVPIKLDILILHESLDDCETHRVRVISTTLAYLYVKLTRR